MKHLIILIFSALAIQAYSQVTIVRDAKGKVETYVKVSPVKPEIEHYDAFVWQSETPSDCPFPQSSDFSKIRFLGLKSGFHFADTWYPTWGDDDILYSPYTDGSCWRLDGSYDNAWSMGVAA
ncbi:MAG: hypothetical protein LBR18_02030, partial [Tannerella sp.]|nr:hypothetical protein [Tannerella sp.]